MSPKDLKTHPRHGVTQRDLYATCKANYYTCSSGRKIDIWLSVKHADLSSPIHNLHMGRLSQPKLGREMTETTKTNSTIKAQLHKKFYFTIGNISQDVKLYTRAQNAVEDTRKEGEN